MRLIHTLSALSVAPLMIGGMFYWITPKTNIAYFDKEVVQGQFIRQLAERKATKFQVERSTRRFNEVLHKVLNDYALQRKTVILSKQDVFAGGVDITDEVRIQLSQSMRNKS